MGRRFRMTGTPDEIAAFFRQAADRLPAELLQAEADNLRTVLESARDHSSGPYSTAMLRRMGHPYARRHRRASLDPGVINVQSGMFLAAWTAYPPVMSGDSIRSQVRNDSAHADFMKGTRTMIPRPIVSKVTEETREAVDLRREQALARVFGG